MSASGPRLIGVVVAVGFVAMAGALPTATSVGAASAGSLRDQAAAIEAHLAAQSRALQSNARTYVEERAQYQSSIAAARLTRSHVATIERTVARDRAVIRSAAVTTYVQAGAASPIGLYLVGKPDQLAIGETYARAANDSIASSIAQLSGESVALSSSLKVEQVQTSQAAAALASTEASRASVLQAYNNAHALLESVNGQLAALVRQAEIAREQAAAKAAAAAAAAAGSEETAGPPATVGVAPVTLTTAVPNSLAAAFAAIRRCESSGVYTLNTGNGYYGAYQFSASTWTRLGGAGVASEASPAAQDAAAYKLYQSSGWGAWPECSAAAGL